MALINRITRLFKADFHAVLDQIEEPEQLLRQAIRDMEDETQAIERDIAACEQEQVQLRARAQPVRASVSEVDSELDLCFETDNDKLAKSLVRKKLETGKLLSSLETKLEENDAYVTSRRKLAAENSTTLESLRQKAGALGYRTRHASSDDVAWLSRELSVNEDEVEIAFLREKSQRSAS
jgi:phage shock protein A